jgi:peptide/nickel transport system substrate-binding protein
MIMMTNTKNVPLIPELKDQYEKGTITRREFVRYAALIGLSSGVASQMVGLTSPGRVLASQLKRGGTLKIASVVHKMTHPAQISSIAPSNMLRQVAEYLTYTDENNVTHPYLLENWSASEDLKTWTLNLRKGIRWNDDDNFTADDVVFTFNEWLNEDNKSSMLGLLSDYLDPSGVEKVDDYQVKLHLKRPEIGVPEHLFHYPALVMNHRTFEGDFLKAPVGTGPYLLKEYLEGERCLVERRNDYWQKGADGNPLPYLDAMEFIDMGTEMAPQITAIRLGEVDMIELGDSAGTDVYQALHKDSNVNVLPVATAQTRVLRMRIDVKPWSDNRVRMALKLCQHREKILQLAYFGQGLQGHDTHVAPIHPEYCEKPIPDYQPEKAKALLEEAGYPNGVDATIAVASAWADVVRYAEILKQDAEPAGFRIALETMPLSQFWEKWMEVPLGITDWTARPLGTMVLNLAYTAGQDGKPVPWNETRWVDPDFTELLREANGTLDVGKRRQIFCQLEDIQMTRGSIGIAYWRNIWLVAGKRLNDVNAHPTNYMLFNKVWLA